MIAFERALEIVMMNVRLTGSETVRLSESLNRILAQDVKSDVDMPAFNKSAMDGYACRRADLDRELTVVETIPAGVVPQKNVGPNLCSKIMTGAIVPDGADCIIRVEDTQNPTPATVRFTGRETHDNICLKSEDVAAGQVVLRKGERILPPHLAILASVGCVNPKVAVRPRVGIIATGDELVEPDCLPAYSQIRNSNSTQLYGQTLAAGAVPTYYGIAEDTGQAIETMLDRAVSESDVVILSGGVSMGDFDLVPGILKKNSFRLLFEKIAIKPGNPTIFGLSENVFCFGLPGNPVSTFTLFELLVKPFLYKMMGHEFSPPRIQMPLGKTIGQKGPDRERWLPVVITPEGTVLPVEFHGSAHILALCQADGLICIPRGVPEVKEGTLVHVRPI